MNKQWCKDLETIAEGFGGDLERYQDWILIDVEGNSYDLTVTPERADMNEVRRLESLAIEKLGEDAFDDAVLDTMKQKGLWQLHFVEPDLPKMKRALPELAGRAARLDAETRARILARMFGGKHL